MVKIALKQFNYTNSVLGLLFLYLGMIYFSIAVSNIFLGIGILIFILGVFTKKIALKFNRNNWYLYGLLTIPFFLTLVSVLNSIYIEKGMKILWLRLPILTIPFVLVFMKLPNKGIKTGIKIFVALTLIACLKTFYNAIRYSNEDVLFKTDFTFFITPIQHPYFGILVLLALISIIEFNLIKNKTVKIIVYMLIAIAIALSTSRLVYILFFIVIGYFILKKMSRKRAILFGGLLCLFSIIFITSNKSIRNKFKTSYNYNNSPRLKLWNNAYKVTISNNNLIFGMGIGDYYHNKKEVYFFKESHKGTLGYNPHSQMVEFFVTNGLFGIFLLLISGSIGVKYIRKQNNFSILVFGVIIAFSFTESILARQYGVQLYSIFMPLVFKENLKKIK